jgi:hypothetical protein
MYAIAEISPMGKQRLRDSDFGDECRRQLRIESFECLFDYAPLRMRCWRSYAERNSK